MALENKQGREKLVRVYTPSYLQLALQSAGRTCYTYIRIYDLQPGADVIREEIWQAGRQAGGEKKKEIKACSKEWMHQATMSKPQKLKLWRATARISPSRHSAEA